MIYFVASTLLSIVSAAVGYALLIAERRERKRRRDLEAFETTRLLEESLERRLAELDAYRHDLAELLQGIDPELVRRVAEGQD